MNLSERITRENSTSATKPGIIYRVHQPKSLHPSRTTPREDRPVNAFILLPLGILILLLPWIMGIDSRIQVVTLVALVTICSIGIVSSCAHGLRPVSLIFYSFTLTWIGIGATYQLSHNLFAWDDYALPSQQALLTRALLLLFGATLTFFVSNTYFHQRPKTELSRTAYEPKTYIIWASIAGAILLAPFSIRASGGLANMFASRSERAIALVEAGVGAAAGNAQLGLLKTLPAALAIAACYLAVHQARGSLSGNNAKLRSTISKQTWAAIFISFSLVWLFCNPFSNTRFLSILAFGSILIAAIRPKTPKAAAIMAACALIGTSIIYPLANMFRREEGSSIGYKTGTEAFASADFDGFQQVANALVFVEDAGHSFGHYMSSALLYFVPRSIWPSKAEPASLEIAENRGYYFTNLSLPFPAELFVEWGALGVLVGMTLLGLLAAKADHEWLSRVHSRLGIIAPVLALVMFGFLRGPLGSLAPLYLTTLGIIIVGLRREEYTGNAVESTNESGRSA